VKLSGSGDIEWEKSLGGSSNDSAISIQQTTDGGYILAGFSYSTDGDVMGHHDSGSYADCWVVKLSGSGDIEWEKSLGGSSNDYANSIQQTTDGGYIVAGSSHSTDGDVTEHHGNDSRPDSWVVKLSRSGNMKWEKSLGGNSWDAAESVQQTMDGGYVVAGWSYSSNGDVTGHHGAYSSDYWVVKLSESGNIEWEKSLGGSKNDRAGSIQQTMDGGYMVAGWSSSTDGDVTGHHGETDSWVVKLK
jgi:hypothetical protein